jgi:hypothetical protein
MLQSPLTSCTKHDAGIQGVLTAVYDDLLLYRVIFTTNKE